jgi:hypothetical protein
MDSPEVIFGLRIDSNWIYRLSLRPDGKLAFQSAGNHDIAIFSGASIVKLRWTHLALVHHKHRATTPSISTSMKCTFFTATELYPRNICRWCTKRLDKLGIP